MPDKHVHQTLSNMENFQSDVNPSKEDSNEDMSIFCVIFALVMSMAFMAAVQTIAPRKPTVARERREVFHESEEIDELPYYPYLSWSDEGCVFDEVRAFEVRVAEESDTDNDSGVEFS
ncbi:hypothetical protein JTB14_010891 [Gonioctena quinquepunctata]|nr:hypothetical protein JTB14_010891 [Gonioctena quinquepunctata]